MREVPQEENWVSANEQVRSEIQSYLQALNSYPDRFAANPDLTFEEHCDRLIRSAGTAPRRRSQGFVNAGSRAE